MLSYWAKPNMHEWASGESIIKSLRRHQSSESSGIRNGSLEVPAAAPLRRWLLIFVLPPSAPTMLVRVTNRASFCGTVGRQGHLWKGEPLWRCSRNRGFSTDHFGIFS